METAELTKNEQSHVERMSEPFSEPTMSERFEEWAVRSISHSKEEKKEKQQNSGAREIKLADRSPEEKDFIAKVGQKPADESKDSAKDSRRESAAEKDAAKRTDRRADAKKSEKPDAKAGEKPTAAESNDSPVEPIANDRYWQRKFEGKEEHDKHWSQVNERAGVVLQYINSHAQKEQIAEGFKAFVAGKPKAWQDAILPDLYSALAEVASPGEVFRHIALQSEDREALRQCKNAQELRAAVHTIAKHYPAAASQASPKPRAPKPPSEVGGRGAVGDDGTRGETNFSNFSARMSQRYAQR